jgi:hypothetical protein
MTSADRDEDMARADRERENEELRKGGPTRTPGIITTTDGKAGPAMRRATGQKKRGKIAPTTTGDAGSGGMNAPTRGTTSSNSSSD